MRSKGICCVICVFMVMTIIMIEVSEEVSAQFTEEWVARYNGPGNGTDVTAYEIVVDSIGNIYITGNSQGIGSHADYTTIMYNSEGVEQWRSRYNGPGNDDDRPSDIALDSNGNVYVTGISQGIGTSQDYTTIKYDSDGNQQWVARYNGPGDSSDDAKSMAIDPDGNIYVTGGSSKTGLDLDYATIKYDPDGNELWVAIFDSRSGDYGDYAHDIVIDSSGDIFVTGYSEGYDANKDYLTIKYDSNGNELWTARYDGIGQNDEALALDLGPDENIYVTGRSEGSSTDYDFVTLGYDTDGTCLWVARYNGPVNLFDSARDIAVGTDGNIYVTGGSWGIGTKLDYTTIAYDSFGNQLWLARYNGLGNGHDYARAITVDLFGNVYITGQSRDNDIATIAYDSYGNELWVAKYNGLGDYLDDGLGITTDSSKNVYITGASWGIGSYYDFIVIKYSQESPNQKPIANAGPDQSVNEGDTVQFDGSSSHDLDGTIESYEWDFDSSDGLWWETGATPDATGPTPTHIYGDDGIFVATLRVTDNDNLSATDTCNITVLNVDPTLETESATMNVEIGLRVAGRKFNDVGMTLYEYGTSIGYVSIERLPGSPNEQMVWIPMTLDLTKTYSAIVTYIPENLPNIGANPVWIYIKSENGSINKIHHTFNVQQSKKRDSDHWNHIEPWEVDLNAHLVGWEFEVDYHVTDPGSDDEILTFTYGSQNVVVTHFNNPPNPDPYPSPGVNPRDIYGTANLVYEGAGTIILQVEDDDGGLTSTSLNIT